jgi:hypothetical protein
MILIISVVYRIVQIESSTRNKQFLLILLLQVSNLSI